MLASLQSPAMPLTSAIVGCGRIGVADSARLAGRVHPSMLPVSHAESMRASQRLELVAFCDTDPDKARAARAAYGTGLPYTDLVSLLRELHPEIVSVATRAADRPGIVQTLAEYGVRGIYAEKPFSRSFADCEAAMSAVQAAGARLVLGTPRRFMRLYRRALEAVADGSLGRLIEVRIELLPNSALMWTLPHSVDLLVYLSGARSVKDVQAIGVIPAGGVCGQLIDCDPIVTEATVRFDNGVIGRLHTGARFCVALVCECGEVQAVESEALLRTIRRGTAGPGRSEDQPISDTMSGTVRAFVELADAVQHGTPSPVSPTEVLLNQALLATIAHSLTHQGQRVSLEEVPRELTITGKVGTLFA
jgi:predicted dehydrogenase